MKVILAILICFFMRLSQKCKICSTEMVQMLTEIEKKANYSASS